MSREEFVEWQAVEEPCPEQLGAEAEVGCAGAPGPLSVGEVRARVHGLLGFGRPLPSVAADVGATQEATLVGQFVPLEAQLVLIESEDLSLEDLDAICLHELFHALRFDAMGPSSAARRSIGVSIDRELAYVSLTEGEAELPAWRFLTRGRPELDEGEGWLMQQLQSVAAAVRGLLQGDGFSVELARTAFPYVAGPPWAAEVLEERGREGLGQLLDEPPASSHLAMRAMWGLPPKQFELPPFPAPDLAIEVRPARERIAVSHDRLGAYLVYGLALIHEESEESARRLALSWRSDQLDYFHFGGERVAARWRVFFQDEASADVFASLFADERERYSVLRRPRAVVVTVGEQRREAWLLRAPWEPSPPR